MSSEAIEWLEQVTFPLCEIVDQWDMDDPAGDTGMGLRYIQSRAAYVGVSRIIDGVQITVSPYCRPMFEVVPTMEYMATDYYRTAPGCPCEDLSRTWKCSLHPDPSPEQLAAWIREKREDDEASGFRMPGDLVVSVETFLRVEVDLEEAIKDIGAA